MLDWSVFFIIFVVFGLITLYHLRSELKTKKGFLKFLIAISLIFLALLAVFFFKPAFPGPEGG